MKRLLTLMLAATFVLGTVASAFAIHTQGRGGAGLDFNARGSWRGVAEIRDSWGFNDNAYEETYQIYMRGRTWFDFATADKVKAVIGLEIGNIRFGADDLNSPGNDFALGGDGRALIKVKHLQLVFPWPNTNVTISAGLQNVALPGYYSNPIFDDDVAGIVMSTPITDTIGLTLAWMRPYDLTHSGNQQLPPVVNGLISVLDEIDFWDTFGVDRADAINDYRAASGRTRGAGDEFDIFAAIVPVTLEGLKLTPYAVYALVGDDFAASPDGFGLGAASTGNHTAWWLGLNAAISMFDPIYAAFDFIYGSAEFDVANQDLDQQGWFVNAAVGMKMAMFTPELFGFYATGTDDGSSKDKRMPTVSGDFVPTSFLFDKSPLGSGLVLQDPSVIGMWGLGLSLKNISFIDTSPRKTASSRSTSTPSTRCTSTWPESSSSAT
jgi:hypothetical protein